MNPSQETAPRCDALDVRTVAQSNLAFYRQMHEHGYSEEALRLARRAYATASALFTARFRASEKPFLCHLVGTASILAQLEASPVQVAAGLLHAAYQSGDFGGIRRRGSTRRNRAFLRTRVGREVEDGVLRYGQMRWDPTSIARLAERIDALSAPERETVVLRLANELEDHLDLAMSYCAGSRARIDAALPRFAPMARALALPALAAAFETVSEEMRHAAWTASLHTGRAGSYPLEPRRSLDPIAALRRLRL